MKIYTKTGDDGTTGLCNLDRVKKDDAVIEAIGTIDELNSWLGVLNSGHIRHDVIGLIFQIQRDLFEIGAIVAKHKGSVADEQVKWLEDQIDRLDATNEPLKNFILPTGTKGCTMMHHARTICRRAERRLITANIETPNIIEYFNRLSDLCFVLARNINQKPEIIWVSDK